MRCTNAAVALGVGYLLGRKRKFRSAAVAAAAAGFGGTSMGGTLLRNGAKMLASSGALSKVAPQLGDLADTVRGDLVDVGKAAVSAALTRQLDSLTDSLHDQAERLRNPAETVTGAAETATGTAADAAGGTARAGTRTGSDVTRRVRGRGSAADEDGAQDMAPDEDDAPRDEDAEYEYSEYEDSEADGEEPYEDEDDQEPEERPVRAATRRRPVVTRSRR